jgi:BolA family transcriptional regulator, general stress-responsive regulator
LRIFAPHPAIDRQAGPPLSDTMAMRDQITEKLIKAFQPASLDVVDESHRHEGHAGHRPGGETHFRVYIVSDAFRGKTRLERHRMVNETLSSELEDRVHALAIHATAPGETGV